MTDTTADLIARLRKPACSMTMGGYSPSLAVENTRGQRAEAATVLEALQETNTYLEALADNEHRLVGVLEAENERMSEALTKLLVAKAALKATP